MSNVTPKMMLEWFQRYQERGHFYGSIPAAIHRLLADNTKLPMEPPPSSLPHEVTPSDNDITAYVLWQVSTNKPLMLSFNPDRAKDMVIPQLGDDAVLVELKGRRKT